MNKPLKVKAICIVDVMLLLFPLSLNIGRLIRFDYPMMSVVLIKNVLSIIALVLIFVLIQKQNFNRKLISILMFLILLSEAGNLIMSDDYGTAYVAVIIVCIVFSLLAFISSVLQAFSHSTLVLFIIRTLLRIVSAFFLVSNLGATSILLYFFILLFYIVLEIMLAIPMIYYLHTTESYN